MGEKKNFTLDNTTYIEHFRVAIFGSARIQKEDEMYQEVFELARSLAHENIDVVTGGGPGLMEAANYGHKSFFNEKAKSIGLTIQLPSEAKENRHLDMHKHFQKFSNRLETFMELSNVVVVMPGGIGTCLELFYTWQLTQVHHKKDIPILLHGEMWHELHAWVKKWPLAQGLMSKGDDRNIYCVHSNEEALKIILEEREKSGIKKPEIPIHFSQNHKS